MPHIVTAQLPDKHNLQKFLQTRIGIMEYPNCTSFTILYFGIAISYSVERYVIWYISFSFCYVSILWTDMHKPFNPFSLNSLRLKSKHWYITTRKLSKYNLHARQHNFNAFSFICVMFMFLSFKERHKNISLEWLLPVAVVDWGNTLLALKKANLTSNAKPRKCLIAVTKRLLRCVSGVKKKMRKDVFCY